MKPEFSMYLLKMLLCNPSMIAFLRAEAAKTSTPIDDTAVDIIVSLLCDAKKQ